MLVLQSIFVSYASYLIFTSLLMSGARRYGVYGLDHGLALSAYIFVLIVLILHAGPAIAPLRAVSTRLLYVLIGLVVLLGLNELSHFGIDISAPPVPLKS